MADVTATQFQQDVNNTADWSNGDENTTVTMRLGQQARSPAKVINDIQNQANIAIQQAVNGFNLSPSGFDFATGGTLTSNSQAVEDASGNDWIYTLEIPEGGYVVTAGTVPSEPVYKQVTFNSDANITTASGNTIREEGISPWDNGTNYGAGAVVKGSDGRLYKAVKINTGEDPTTDSGDVNWYEGFSMEYFRSVRNDANGIALMLGDFTEDVSTIGAGSVLIGGYTDANKNRLSGTRILRSILAGYDNEITSGTVVDDGGLACVIVGSHHSSVTGDATHTYVAGGSYLTVDGGDYNGIFGGTRNSLISVRSRATHSAILAGRDNEVDGGNGLILGSVESSVSGDYSSVRAGRSSSAEGDFTNVTGANNESRRGDSGNGGKNTISGGRYNVIDSLTNASSSTIAGGESNQCNGLFNSVGGGNRNECGTTLNNATYATISGGLDNKVTAETAGTVGGGRLNESEGDYSSVTHGRECKSLADYSRAGGYQASANHKASDAISSGMFSSIGDAQTSVIHQKVDTADEIPLSMGALVISDNTSWMFQVNIVARSGASNESAAYTVAGCIKRNVGEGSTALVGTPTVTVIAEDSASWDVSATANNVSGSLSIEVSGESSKSIRWSSRVVLTEISF